MSTPSVPAPASASPPRSASLDQLCGYLREAHPGDTSPLCDFARLFFAKVPRALLQERSVETLAALTESAYRFLERARPDEVDVQVVNPENDAVPWVAPVTVIRAEVGDRPFIVDTIREYLGAEGLSIFHAIYPVLRVHRDPGGAIRDVGPATEGEGGTLESLVHCEVSRIGDGERRAQVEAEVARRLGDVVDATTDFPSMQAALRETAALMGRYAAHFPERAEEFAEARDFLRWLERDNFVFLGFRSYHITGAGEDRVLRVQPESGLGILRETRASTYADPVPLATLPDAFRARVEGGPLLVVSKANAESTVHRRARLDYIGIKTLDDEGRVTGERRFLGLFTSKAYGEHAEAMPILRRKLHEILAATGARPGTHDYKEIITIFNSMPKESLFQGSAEQIGSEVQAVLGTLFNDEVRVLVRPDATRRGTNVTVMLPRGKFSGDVRRQIEATLTRRLGGRVLNYYLAMGAGDQARLHFYLATPDAAEDPDATRGLEREIAAITRSWDDRLREGLASVVAAGEVEPLVARYASAFSAEYRAANSAAAAVHDVLVLERMTRQGHDEAVDLRPSSGETKQGARDVSSLKLYVRERRLVLSDFMPILEDAGVRVVEVDTFALAGPGLPPHMIYSFSVQGLGGSPIPEDRAADLAEMLLAVRAGDAPADAYNALVLGAGLRWREVEILRSYAYYAFQIGAVPTRRAPARALLAYPHVARLLVALFAARFDPDRAGSDSDAAALRLELGAALEAVTSLADDRSLRRIATLVEATTRTNYFRHGGADPTARSGGVPYLSLKIRDADVEELKKSRLLYEIFVHSSRMEGIHLRGAPVSRGGIRWSDRPDDFRLEILGLVKTQMIKNATIVPGGSKGGFVTLRSFAEREEMGREAAEQYRTLIRGMLDITDNLQNGRVIPPPRVVRHDGDDPYLVVAADKGTAHLSDTANAVAAEYDFWLGDAFASGGSNGYDHKEEGITARGAWECVRRHFREMGKDVQTEPFTVAGIGDMSGDVFGNGMLLSPQIRLQAAFDHRHIFLDPDPDPAASFAERERLFALSRSSWNDYDRAKLSAGGMIVPRASKAVQVTPEVRAALGLDDEIERLDGEALVRAVLLAPTELFWNGGIGTYVKAAEETDADVGDTANDPVRVDAEELRCKVVGEGGNLGFTQLARVVFALRGGRINTDALDNSAGVDMSDHEVNLKILLGRVVADGDLSLEGRNELLAAMTDEVSELVLANNRGQSLAVSLDEPRSRDALDDFAELIRALERAGVVARGADQLPSSEVLAERAEAGIGLTRPALCVLLAHAKMQAKAQLLASGLPDDPGAELYLEGYFPPAAVRAARMERLREHPLRREIVVTELVNDLVNLMGASFLHRVVRHTGQDTAAVARAWLIASCISGTREIRADLEGLGGRFPAAAVYRWLHGLARVLEGTTRWALANLPADADTVGTIHRLQGGLALLRGEFARIVTGADRELFIARLAELEELGVDRVLGERLITLRFLPQLLEILSLVPDTAEDAVATARAYYQVSERLDVAGLQQEIRQAAGDDPWERRHAQLLVEDAARAQRAVTQAVTHGDVDTSAAALDRWEREHARQLAAYRAVREELDDDAPLAGCAVAVRKLMVAAEV